MFKLHSEYKPTGDQPQAIEYLSNGINNGKKFQTLLGVTGSGKTFTMANIIQKVQRRENQSIFCIQSPVKPCCSILSNK